MRLRCAPIFLLAVSCRHQLQIDTNEAKFIPRDVALDGLKELLATADVAECTQPKRCLRRDEIKEWVLDDDGLEARADGKPSIRVAFKDVTATRLDKVALYYQVRLFTPGQPNPKKDYVHFNWTSEGTARRTLELIDALCRKSTAHSPARRQPHVVGLGAYWRGSSYTE
jgi:hypothetical protein